jgi:hypothetical protein
LTVRLGPLLVMGDYPIRQLTLHTGIFVGWYSWEFNPGVLESIWLKASTTSGGSLRQKASVMGSRPCHFPHYALAFSLQLRKSTENLGKGKRTARGLLLGPTLQSFEGCLSWPAGRQIDPVCQVTSLSPRSAELPPELPY